MSLKAFHLFFISLAILLAFGCAVAEGLSYRDYDGTVHLLVAIASGLFGLLLIAYEVWFWKKTRKLIL
ncbi:MAG: hypothetical protein M3O82_05850 [Verrucomicrobiota bacterium]|nr:hypothetical protein [Verrucomicrobiota bacterium]